MPLQSNAGTVDIEQGLQFGVRMIDFLRPLLFPVTVCTIVGCVWTMGWNRSLESDIQRTAKPVVLDRGDRFEAPDRYAAPEPIPHANAD
jgi:hypothetical protein